MQFVDQIPNWLEREHQAALCRVPSTVVMLAFPQALEEKILTIVGAAPRIANVPTCSAAAAQLQRAQNACLMLLVPDRTGPHAAADRDRLLQWYQDVPVIAIFDHSTSNCAALLELGRFGVSEVVETEELSVDPFLRDSLRRCQSLAVSLQLWKLCSAYVPAALAPLLRLALHLANVPISVSDLAANLNMSESTLGIRCSSSALPPPKWIVAWARIATLAYFVERFHCSVADAVSILQFSSGRALHKVWGQMKAHSGEMGPLSLDNCLNILRMKLHQDQRDTQLEI